MAARLTIRISGKVQGVYFRQTAKREARQLGLAGIARNEPNGDVLIDVEGDAVALDWFLAWCRVGPPTARVDNLTYQEGDALGYEGFETK